MSQLWVAGCLTLIRTIIEQIRNNSVFLFIQAKTKLTNVEVKLCTGHYNTVEEFSADLRGRLLELVEVEPESKWIHSLYNSVDEQLEKFEMKPGNILSRITEDDFTKPLQDYLCPICSNILMEPCLTPCGHHFCRECITQSLQHKPECPIDRKNLSGYIPFRDMSIERKIQNKTIKCPNQRIKKSEDCQWKGSISMLKEHFLNCLLEETQCEWGCRKNMERRELQKHELECPLRFSVCEFCQTRVHVKNVFSHSQFCGMVPIHCSNLGCLEKFPRKELFRHNQACGFFPVDCPFRENGCSVKCLRKGVDEHLRNYVGKHLELLQRENYFLKNQKKSSEICLVDYLDLKKKIRLMRINNFEADPVGVFNFPNFHIGEYEFELIFRRSSSQPYLSTSLMVSQRKNKITAAIWPICLSYKIFIQNQVWSSEFLESENFFVEFKNSGTVDLKNPFLVSAIHNGGLIVNDSFKIGIFVDIVHRETGFSSVPPSASVLFQDSSATFSFGKPEDLPQFSFGLPDSSSPHRANTSRTKPVGHTSGPSSPLFDYLNFTFPMSNPPIKRGTPSWPTSQTMSGGNQVVGSSTQVTNTDGPGTGTPFLQETYTGVFL